MIDSVNVQMPIYRQCELLELSRSSPKFMAIKIFSCDISSLYGYAGGFRHYRFLAARTMLRALEKHLDGFAGSPRQTERIID